MTLNEFKEWLDEEIELREEFDNSESAIEKVGLLLEVKNKLCLSG